MPETLVLDEFAFGLGPDVVTYEVLWQTFAADACLKCQVLQGETWNLKSLTGTLVSESQGAVYDLDADMCITHPNCRCFLNVVPQIELENTELFKALNETLVKVGQEMPSNIDDAKKELSELGLAFDLTYKNIRQVESLLLRTVSLMRRMGLSEDATRAAEVLLRLVSIASMLQRSFWLLEMQGGPLGWALAGVGVVSSIASGYDMMLEVSGR